MKLQKVCVGFKNNNNKSEATGTPDSRAGMIMKNRLKGYRRRSHWDRETARGIQCPKKKCLEKEVLISTIPLLCRI